VVLKWLSQQGVASIPRASSTSHLASNSPRAVAATPELTEDELELVRSAAEYQLSLPWCTWGTGIWSSEVRRRQGRLEEGAPRPHTARSLSTLASLACVNCVYARPSAPQVVLAARALLRGADDPRGTRDADVVDDILNVGSGGGSGNGAVTATFVHRMHRSRDVPNGDVPNGHAVSIFWVRSRLGSQPCFEGWRP